MLVEVRRIFAEQKGYHQQRTEVDGIPGDEGAEIGQVGEGNKEWSFERRMKIYQSIFSDRNSWSDLLLDFVLKRGVVELVPQTSAHHRSDCVVSGEVGITFCNQRSRLPE